MPTYNYTGAVQTYTVPGGTTSLAIDISGAAGGSGGGATPGNGGRVQASIPVTPGEVLYIYVGGTNGYNGGGAAGASGWGVNRNGGGATDVRRSPYGLADRIAVAGGGGGGAHSSAGAGGQVGGDAGDNGYPIPPRPASENGGGGGKGGTATAGGAGGGSYSQGAGVAGSLGLGGAGGAGTYGGGGGGGGYYGGGGGGAGGFWGGAAGGGGSGYLISGSTGAIWTSGYNSTNGVAVIGPPPLPDVVNDLFYMHSNVFIHEPPLHQGDSVYTHTNVFNTVVAVNQGDSFQMHSNVFVSSIHIQQGDSVYTHSATLVGRTANSLTFTIVQVTILDIIPDPAPIPGGVTIMGTMLDRVHSVYVDGRKTSFRILSPSQIWAGLPLNVSSSTVEVYVEFD